MAPISKKITNKGVQIAYQVLGNPSPYPPLVMVIGLSGVKEDWKDLPLLFSKNRQVIILDNRGVGESDTPSEPYTVEIMAQDVAAIIKELNVPKVDLIGQSLGGMICQFIAVHYPEQVNKLIIMSSSHGGLNQAPLRPESAQAFQTTPGASKHEKAAKVLAINFTPQWINENPERFDNIVNESVQYRRSGRGILNQVSAVMTFNLEEEIKSLTLPVLVVHGTQDQLLDFKNGKMIAEKIPNATLSPIQGAGHMTWIMDEGKTLNAVDKFLTGD